VLTPELAAVKEELKEYALEYGLDFFETIFEVLDFKQMNEVASYMGFPTRYPHWRFGMEYQRMEKGYAYGLHKIYEMVINNDPCYAYLLKSNNQVDQKIVIAHVYAHCDFFKNNLWFSKTNRKMMDEMANHGTRVQRYIERFGLERVEHFLDTCLSIEDLIDWHSPFIKRRMEVMADPEDEDEADLPRCQSGVRKLKSKPYMDRYINPKNFIEEQRKQAHEAREHKLQFPENPEKDVLLFLVENAPLENWQRDILSMIREESYYFAPQGQTKIMNEGWATYWHSKIMTHKALNDSEVIDYADHHSGTLASSAGSLNPYKIGVEIFRNIEDRWNKGKFGKEYDECEDMNERKNWDKDLGLGREKIFEVRKLYNDVTFIDTFLTEEFCIEHSLFVFKYNKKAEVYEIASRKFKEIKEKLLFQLTNFGRPFFYATDANYKNRGELYLQHRHEGIDLKLDHARDTLRNVQMIWNRPVNLETVFDGKGILLTYDGDEHTTSKID